MPEIYTPVGAKTLAESGEQQIRLGLQAEPFAGKTTAAMSFPNPVVVSYDQKLGAFTGRADIIEIPIWDPAWSDKIIKRDGMKCPPNRKDALLIWLASEGIKLQKNQTLVIDGSTGLESAFHQQYAINPQLTRTGEIDGFMEWRLKVIYMADVMMALKALKCHVVYICHETPDRDKKGELTGKNRPLMTGQFGDQLASHFTDWFRVLAVKKPKDAESKVKFMKHFNLDDSLCNEWLQFGTKETLWVFQTQSDDLAACGTSTLINCPKFILADYKSFSKYRRQP